MYVIGSTGEWSYAVVHLDDIVTILKTPGERINYTRMVSRLLKTGEIAVKLKKRPFSQK